MSPPVRRLRNSGRRRAVRINVHDGWGILEISRRTEIGPETPGLIVYTSGTTGKPKGAILTQRNLVQDARNIIRIWEITGSDVLCHALPLFHVHGLCFALHTTLMVGSRILMLNEFSPQNVI